MLRFEIAVKLHDERRKEYVFRHDQSPALSYHARARCFIESTKVHGDVACMHPLVGRVHEHSHLFGEGNVGLVKSRFGQNRPTKHHDCTNVLLEGGRGGGGNFQTAIE